MKTDIIRILTVAILFTGCGDQTTNEQSALTAIASSECEADATYRDEYDCDASTRVINARVLDTLWNGPASGQFVADIKNVDITEESLQVYVGSGSRLRYQVFVRSWVDFGPKTLAFKAIDKDRPDQPMAETARRVGRDANGQTIYMMSLPVTLGKSHQLYLTIDYQGRTHYSNVGKPNVFFEIHTRGL